MQRVTFGLAVSISGLLKKQKEQADERLLHVCIRCIKQRYLFAFITGAWKKNNNKKKRIEEMIRFLFR